MLLVRKRLLLLSPYLMINENCKLNLLTTCLYYDRCMNAQQELMRGEEKGCLHEFMGDSLESLCFKSLYSTFTRKSNRNSAESCTNAIFHHISENFASLAKAGMRSWILGFLGPYKNWYLSADTERGSR